MRITTYLSSFADKTQGLRWWYDDLKYSALVLTVDDKMFTTKNPRVILSCDWRDQTKIDAKIHEDIITNSFFMIALVFNELCECNYTKVSTYHILILSICETIRAFSLLNLDPFEFVCELNYHIRMRKKLNQSSLFYRYIAKVYGNMMN